MLNSKENIPNKQRSCSPSARIVSLRFWISRLADRWSPNLPYLSTIWKRATKRFWEVCSSGQAMGVIVCDNSLDSRVRLIFEQLLPVIRGTLFPKLETKSETHQEPLELNNEKKSIAIQ